jgi:hypothetical protein
MTETIFQVSDLANKRTEFLEAAREGGARLRDRDGTSLVMLPESRLNLLEVVARASQAVTRLGALLRRGSLPSVTDLGELAWLRPFDMDDLRVFIEELNEAIISAYADGDKAILDQCLQSWRVTAQQLEDPLRRSVLLGHRGPDDYVDAPRPSDDTQ